MRFESLKTCGQCEYRLYPLVTGGCPAIQIVPSWNGIKDRSIAEGKPFRCKKASGVIRDPDIVELAPDDQPPRGHPHNPRGHPHNKDIVPWFKRAFIRKINKE